MWTAGLFVAVLDDALWIFQLVDHDALRNLSVAWEVIINRLRVSFAEFLCLFDFSPACAWRARAASLQHPAGCPNFKVWLSAIDKNPVHAMMQADLTGRQLRKSSRPRNGRQVGKARAPCLVDRYAYALSGHVIHYVWLMMFW
jgi:hypothetical protein